MKSTESASIEKLASTSNLSEDLIAVLTPMINTIGMFLLMVVALSAFVQVMKQVQVREASEIRRKPSIPDTPGVLIVKMFEAIEGEFAPNWVEDLIKLEKKGETNKGIAEALKRQEDAFRLQMKSYQENMTLFKKLDHHVMSNGIRISPHSRTSEDWRLLADNLSKQKVNLLRKGEEILSLRLQTSNKELAKVTEELKAKTEKELDTEKKMDIQRELELQNEREAEQKKERTVEENVLTTILSSEESTEEMKQRAEQLLPHFKGKTEAEQRRELKQQDFELDLLTLERIVKGNKASEEIKAEIRS